MKKILSILSALALLASVSCGNKPEEESSTTSYTAEKISDVKAYRKNNLAVPENCSMIWTFMPYNGGEDYLLLGSGMKSPDFWHTKDFNSYENVDYPEFDIGVEYGLDCADDGTVVTFLVCADQEADESGEYPDNTEFRFVIKTYKDGVLVSSADVEDFGVEPEQRMFINGVYSDGEIVIAKISGALEMFKVSGEYIGELTSDDWDIDAIGKDKNGRLICTAASMEKDSDTMKLCFINPDGTLTDCNSVVYDFAGTPQGIQVGMGDYDLFIWSMSTIFGIKTNGEIEPLLNINVAGMTADSFNGIVLTESGNVAVISNDYSTWSVSFKEYIPRTAEEMADIPVLTLGAIDGGDSVLRNYVTNWNDEGHDFILEYKNYESDYDENGFRDMGELREDMLTGNLPDIMLIENDYSVDLAGNGALCDLYEFIDSDDTISRDTFVPNTLHCFEKDDKLYSLPNRFFLNAGDVAKTKFVGDGSDWSLDKQIDVITDPTLDLEIDHDSKQQRLCYSVSYTDWIDRKNATCHYSDESFIKYLDWCNIPDNIESEYADYDWEDMTEEEREAIMIENQSRYIDDKDLFDSFSWMTYTDYVRDTRGEFNGEEITYLETPVLEAGNKLAITSTSEHKDLAWKYIKSKLSDDYYTVPKNQYVGPFPITKSGLEIYLARERSDYIDFSQYEEITDPYWLNYHGVTYQLGYWIYGDNVMQLGEITDEDVQTVNDMIAKAEPSDSVYLPLGNAYYEIMDEELHRFFNGETTSRECAEYIQDRVSIYLSERFG